MVIRMPRKKQDADKHDAEPQISPITSPLGYFADPSTRGHDYITIGCTPLDCILGGGLLPGRVCQILGDNSTGKTLLAIQAARNFYAKDPNTRIRYFDSEEAFDSEYAAALGLDLDKIQMVEVSVNDPKRGEKPKGNTVENFGRDFQEFCLSGKPPQLYVIDSLDMLSTEADLKKDMADTGYGGPQKARTTTEILRRCNTAAKASGTTLMIISQTRDNIANPMSPVKWTTGGGSVVKFAASQRIRLKYIGKKDTEIDGSKRIVGVNVEAECIKNKVGLPFRKCTFPILFGFGIDDVEACVRWLTDHKPEQKSPHFMTEAEAKDIRKGYNVHKSGVSAEDYYAKRSELRKRVEEAFPKVETKFLPTFSA